MQTVAIVNNDPNLVKSLEYDLRAAGFCVRAYLRTDEALAALIGVPADIAIIDKTNPPLGGIELFRHLRRHTHMPVIFLSAWADDVEEELRVSGMEAEAYINLPASVANVRQMVQALLALQRA